MATLEAPQAGAVQTPMGASHRSRLSNHSMSLIDLHQKQAHVATIDPLVEIQDFHAEKEIIMDAYQKIDKEDNGDIELEEFKDGLFDLGVELNDDEMDSVFKLMDSDNSNYVDRNEFIMFLTQRFESSELARYQEAVLCKVRGKKHKRVRSGIIKADDAGTWDPMELTQEEREMRQMMEGMITHEIAAVKQEEVLFEELQEQEKDPNFGKVENCAAWNVFEVAAWLEEHKLNEYMTAFMQERVDGSSLLYDLDRSTLTVELGIKRVHVEKIMRAIQELRDEIRTDWDQVDVVHDITFIPEERATDAIMQLKGEISERDQTISELTAEYESRIEKLLGEILEKEGIIRRAEQDGFIINDDGGDGDDDDDLDGDSSMADSGGSVTDEDMPPLIGDDERMQTTTVVETIMEHPNESHSDNNENENDDNDDSDHKDDSNDNETMTPTEMSATKARQERSSTVIQIDDAMDAMDAHSKSESVLFNDSIVEDKILSTSPSPRDRTPMNTLSPQTSHPQSLRKGKHHRKKSSKFWGGKKKPPVGTKAYWLYLDERKKDNANFALPHRVLNWHHHEVAYWLKSVKCEKYAEKFCLERVSGEHICHDMTTAVLNGDLGVKMLHCGKLIREMRALKIQAGLQYGISDFSDCKYVPSKEESAVLQMSELRREMSEKEGLWEEERKENLSVSESHKTETAELKNEICELEKQIVFLEKRKVLPLNGSDDDLDDFEVSQVTENENDEKKLDIQISAMRAVSPPKFAKGYFRKFPKEIRKKMREILVVSAASESGSFGAVSNCNRWSNDEVLNWLTVVGLDSYCQSFHESGIDGEILVNDLNVVILHEDLAVKRFHCGKMLREIQALRHGGSAWTVSSNVSSYDYEIQFSACSLINDLRTANAQMKSEMSDLSDSISELTSRPQISESEMIIAKSEWETMSSEQSRLEAQVDLLENENTLAKEAAVPEQEKAEAKEKMDSLLSELSDLRAQNVDSFGSALNVRNWSVSEVMHWISELGYSDYIFGIQSQKINGEILIVDMSAEVLSRDVGVSRIHINPILRKIQELKRVAFGYDICECAIDATYAPEVTAQQMFYDFRTKIDGLQAVIAEKQELYLELMREKESEIAVSNQLRNEKDALLSDIESLNSKISNLNSQFKEEMSDLTSAEISELNSQIETHLNTISQNLRDFELEKEELIAQHSVMISEKDASVSELNGSISDLQTSLAEAHASISDFENIAAKQKEELEQKDNSERAQLGRRAENDLTFGVPSCAYKWSILEVSHWLYTIKIPDYVSRFQSEMVDGEMLLSDLSAEQLRSDLQIKQYHIGKITREIAKLRALATPPLSETDFFTNCYVPEKTAVDTIAELQKEVHEEKDINSALNMEISKMRDQFETLTQVQILQAEMRQTPGGSGSGSGSQEMKKNEKIQENSKNSDIEIEKLMIEIEWLQKSKMDLAMTTAQEMQKLRRMVRTASKAYETLTGTPIGKVANWPGTHRFFTNLGFHTNNTNHSSHSQSQNSNIY